MPENAADPIRLKNLVAEARARLGDELGKRAAEGALRNLQQATDSVDHDQNLDGLAIFANETFEVVLKTRFTLPSRLVIDESFALRTVLRAERRSEPYTALVLSLNEARLFTGTREDLQEVRGGGFPAKNSGPGAGAKVPSGPGVDGTASVDESRRQFVRTCFNLLQGHDNLPRPLVVSGTPEMLTLAREHVGSPFELWASLAGSFVGDNIADLGGRVWEAIREARRANAHDLLDQLENARSSQRYEAGIQALAPLAAQGRISLLVSGFDVQVPGRYDSSTGLFTEVGEPDNWTDLDDGVEWLVGQVLDHGGTVRFAEDELLGEHRLAAILRY